MTESAQLSNYQLQIEGFEGPLDVLLRLIEQQKLSVTDVSLVLVSSGFLRYLSDLKDPPPQLLADFARVAARLLVLKSRSLLPVAVVEQNEDTFDDLVTQLNEYKRARQLAIHLQDSEVKHWRAYPRGAQVSTFPARLRISVPSLDRLQNMMTQVRERREVVPGVVAMSRVVSIAAMTRRILNTVLRSQVVVRFTSLANFNNRSEVVAGFIALLSLLHSQRIEASQSELFGPIYLHSSINMPEDSRRAND